MKINVRVTRQHCVGDDDVLPICGPFQGTNESAIAKRAGPFNGTEPDRQEIFASGSQS